MIHENHLPPSPPPEVRRAIEAASEAYEALNGSGRQVHFGLDQGEHAVAVELRDLAGNSLTTLSPGDALQLAGGGELT